MSAKEQSSDERTPVPTTETDAPSQPSNITSPQKDGMQHILNMVYEYRNPDGHDPSAIFHKKVNRRFLPAYYEIIEEPIAMSTIKAKLKPHLVYSSFSEFVRDFALIPHNAQVYNRPDAGAYHDALKVKEILELELNKLVDAGVITAEIAKLPYFGEIPPQEDFKPLPEEEEREEEEEEDEEAEESEASSVPKRRGRGRPKGSTNQAKREALAKMENDPDLVDAESRKRRGRPPKVDTPMEARIKNILKAIRRPKDPDSGQYKIISFDRLPDKVAMPEYFNEIKSPMSVDVLKKKLKRKKFQSLEQFMRDVDQMFENAKMYNEDDSQIHKDAVELQALAHKLAEEEQKRPDSDFVMEDGRLPLPNGILHNGELYKVGDWVHIQNLNDLTKPIIAQIYRTWQDAGGQKFVNACWYYRPEQTVHRFDKHFFVNEVVKTGQYRDHTIEEVIDRCFVMFITRFSKGRPRGLPADKDVYVCEARYNEEKHTLNKIKTWASCLPDEVRDKDYEMELFEQQKKMKKQPSPIAYLLKDEAKETDELPKPDWGADNAPPKIGAVHKRPRDPKESPPPEPTPSPPPREPTPPPPPPQPAQMPPNSMSQGSNYPRASSNGMMMNATARQAPMISATPQPYRNAQHLQPQQSNRSSIPPVQHGYATRPTGYSSHTPQTGYASRPTQPDLMRPFPPTTTAYARGKHDAPPLEVWSLADAANNAIPAEIRSQFQCDEHGRVLFFTAPPLDTVEPEKEGAPLGHSVKYLAAKVKREALLREKRKRDELEEDGVEERRLKAAKLDRDRAESVREELKLHAMRRVEQQIAAATQASFQQLYGEHWRERMKEDLDALAARQHQAHA